MCESPDPEKFFDVSIGLLSRGVISYKKERGITCLKCLNLDTLHDELWSLLSNWWKISIVWVRIFFESEYNESFLWQATTLVVRHKKNLHSVLIKGQIYFFHSWKQNFRRTNIFDTWRVGHEWPAYLSVNFQSDDKSRVDRHAFDLKTKVS